MAAALDWHEYGEICRARGALAMEVFACLSSPARDGAPPTELLTAHLEYQKELEARGQLFLAGPLSDTEGQRMSGSGWIVYAARNIDEARSLAENDPMHRDGHRTFTLQAWRLNEGSPLLGLRLSSRSFDVSVSNPQRRQDDDESGAVEMLRAGCAADGTVVLGAAIGGADDRRLAQPEAKEFGSELGRLLRDRFTVAESSMDIEDEANRPQGERGMNDNGSKVELPREIKAKAYGHTPWSLLDLLMQLRAAEDPLE